MNVLNIDKTALLDEKGSLRIIMFLDEKKEGKISDFYKIPGVGQGSAYNAVSNLKDLGLIEERRDRFNARIFKLTEKGRKVAEKIREIQKILEK